MNFNLRVISPQQIFYNSIHNPNKIKMVYLFWRKNKESKWDLLEQFNKSDACFDKASSKFMNRRNFFFKETNVF